MRVIVVDDEKLALLQFELEIAELSWVTLEGAFANPFQALEYCKKNSVEAAFLDIAMPGMSGILLAEKLREINPKLVIIFITGYEQYTLDALRVKADYYLTKPYTSEDLKEVLERARLLSRRQKKRVNIRTFGRFDVFVDDQAIYFANAKAKELLALCVDRRGGIVTIEEAADKLWEEREYDIRVKNLYRKAVMHIRQVFLQYDVENIFLANRGSCQINTQNIDCDYYQLLEGDTQAIREWELTGNYLYEYSWAEETKAKLELAEKSFHKIPE